HIADEELLQGHSNVLFTADGLRMTTFQGGRPALDTPSLDKCPAPSLKFLTPVDLTRDFAVSALRIWTCWAASHLRDPVPERSRSTLLPAVDRYVVYLLDRHPSRSWPNRRLRVWSASERTR